MQPISEFSTQHLALSSSRRRTGKVARLPAATREKLNQMLDDGLPYADIIQALGPQAAHLTPDNLSNWSRGGFQDWLVLQDRHSLAEDIYHHIAQHDQPDDPDALYEKTVRIAAAQVCAALALFPRPDPDSENFIDHIKALSQILNPKP